MTIEIKKSIKPVEYSKAISFLENRMSSIIDKKGKELIWVLEHPDTYTAGTSHKKSEILDKSIKIIETNRGGKITYHGPGQVIFYLVIDLNKRSKDIRKFVHIIENSIIKSLKEFKINSFSDRKNIGIWTIHNEQVKKIAAIGIKVKRWIAYHGFAININTDLKKYKKIIPCGIRSKEISNLNKIKLQSYKKLPNQIIKNLIINLKT